MKMIVHPRHTNVGATRISLSTSHRTCGHGVAATQTKRKDARWGVRTPNQWLSHAQPVGPRHTPCSPQKDSGVRRTAAASCMHSGRPTVVNTDLCTVAVSRIESAGRVWDWPLTISSVGFASAMSKATLPTKLGGGTNLSGGHSTRQA